MFYKTKNNVIRQGLSDNLLKIICYTSVGLFALICLFPFALMITSSFMSEKEIVTEGYKLFPKKFTVSAYKFLLSNPQKLVNAYKITIFNTVVGTTVGLFLMSMAGYVLNRKDFKYRNFFAFFIYFTTLFSGGLIPRYILMVKYLGLKDNILAMILPNVISAWYIFLMRNFMKSIPDSLYESATIDGAGVFRIYWQIVLPLSIPALATVGLFLALGFWNEWYNAMLYIESPSKFPLQYFLQKTINQTNVQILINQGVMIDISELPTQSIKMATAVVATGPIIFLYPFVQRYFIKGLTIGAIKG
ncbi:carbohydrate ABC transporter permease [Caldicoprobacter algeriensis]|uniref:carbohydrate ABC transporter permease n=1 Tax=Caldicoprobacter algeriensis TaxID=699281 RepID=UPI00207A6C66|nr:carbohydrate ABC transporter permease [Caldicoprobacter algeriensis]MCM8899897.1 carbohydrate ABC transporter permease [Caldicoprobacter algeriensis]